MLASKEINLRMGTMNYKIKEVNGCTKLLSFSFDSVDLSAEINESLKVKQKDANLKGYRPGKAPLSVIQQMYGPQVENEALYSFVTKEFYNAIDKEGLKPVGYPKFDNTKYEADSKNIAFEATVEIFPEFEIKDYSSYSFSKEPDAIEEKDLELVQKQMLDSKAELTLVEGDVAVEKGHFTIMNFEGEKEDGERPENMKGKEFSLEIGSNQFIPGFEEGLIGMKKGEKKTLELTFPENYHAEDLKNAKVKFHVELNEIKEKKHSDFNDEFVKGFDFESVEDFKAKTLDRLAADKKRRSDEKLHQEILEKLVEENKFDLPKAMVESQVKALKDETDKSLKQNGFNDTMVEDYFNKWSADFETKADFQVRSGLILNKLAEKYNVETLDSDLDAKFEEMSKASGMDFKQVKEMYGGNENLVNNLKYAIREEKTFDKFKAEVTVKS